MFNLVNNTVTKSFSIDDGVILATVFIDLEKRFIYLQKGSGSHQVYDTLTETLVNYNGTVGATMWSDSDAREMYGYFDTAGTLNIYGYNLTVDNTLTMSYVYPIVHGSDNPFIIEVQYT